jgi:hypothetical protein
MTKKALLLSSLAAAFMAMATPAFAADPVYNGTNLLTNGDFSAGDTSWIFNGAVFNGSNASLDSADSIYQTIATEVGVTYQLFFTFSGLSTGVSVTVTFGLYSSGPLSVNTAYVVPAITETSATDLKFAFTGSGSVTIDDVAVNTPNPE